jgi:hypothetical protein
MANIIGNNFWEGSLSVVQLLYNSIDLGKTTEDTTLEYIEDIKDILYQQDGTQPADKIRTGAAYQVTATFGEIDTELVTTLIYGTTASGDGNSVKLSRELYRSGKTSESKELILKKVDSEGSVSTDPRQWATFYLAMPQITGNFVYGADTQRGLEVTFYCFYDSTNGAFGYSGYASSLGL